jgi:hypothetical protein
MTHAGDPDAHVLESPSLRPSRKAESVLVYQHITPAMEFALSCREPLQDLRSKMAQPYGTRLADGFRLMGVVDV